MPELPEVEQVRKSLLPHIKGKKIEQADIRLPRMILSPALPDFIRGVEGRSFADVKRRGKYLLLELDDTNVILTHLRMTGSLLALPKNAPEPAFGKVRLRLSGTEDLWFTDLRTFGTMRLLKPSEFSLDKGFSSLGPEPLSEEFTEEYLKAVLKKSHQAIKSLLLDQRKIAGLGNIYVDEALAAAGIRPTRTAAGLRGKKVAALYEAINQVIAQGLRNHGTTFRNYQAAEGKIGNNKDYLLVYGRKGQPCKSCGSPLKQIKVGGRGSVYCPHCQK